MRAGGAGLCSCCLQPANDTTVAWSATLNEPARSNVVDWRWQARIHDAPRQVGYGATGASARLDEPRSTPCCGVL